MTPPPWLGGGAGGRTIGGRITRRLCDRVWQYCGSKTTGKPGKLVLALKLRFDERFRLLPEVRCGLPFGCQLNIALTLFAFIILRPLFPFHPRRLLRHFGLVSAFAVTLPTLRTLLFSGFGCLAHRRLCRVWTHMAIRATARKLRSHRKRAARGDTNTRFEHRIIICSSSYFQ